jgi:hypothetical protein
MIICSLIIFVLAFFTAATAINDLWVYELDLNFLFVTSGFAFMVSMIMNRIKQIENPSPGAGEKLWSGARFYGFIAVLASLANAMYYLINLDLEAPVLYFAHCWFLILSSSAVAIFAGGTISESFRNKLLKPDTGGVK